MTDEIEHLVLEAKSHAVQGDLARARVLLKRAIAKDPKNVHALVSLGTLLNTTEDGFKDAAKYFVQAAKLEPMNASIWGQLGESMLRLREFERAEKYLRKAIELNPEEGNFWHRLGLLMDMMERPKDAMDAVMKSIELNPNEDTTWITLGSIHYKLEEIEKAREAYMKAIELNPRNSYARQKLFSLSEKHGTE